MPEDDTVHPEDEPPTKRRRIDQPQDGAQAYKKVKHKVATKKPTMMEQTRQIKELKNTIKWL